jgi:imidazoleglycerol-phosphate dehydratase
LRKPEELPIIKKKDPPVPDRAAGFARKTVETEIEVEVHMGAEAAGGIRIDTGVPFFSHVLRSMAFHGRFGLAVEAKGDLEVDEHHLVEDTGLVLGEALRRLVELHGPVDRFGHAVIPMDDALAEVTIDVSGRPYLVFAADFPQERVGSFPVALLRDFLGALAHRAAVNVHARVRYGENSHHMAEALFKALGLAIRQAYALRGGDPQSSEAGVGSMSTKGTIA